LPPQTRCVSLGSLANKTGQVAAQVAFSATL
jgi:hypothetical protein